MIRNKMIVVVGLQPWDIEIGSNCKDVAMEFSKHNKVLYVNAPMDRYTWLFRRRRPAVKRRLEIFRTKDNLVEVAPNIWNLYPQHVIKSINWIPIHPLFDSFNKKNNERFAGDIQEAIVKLGFKDFILFNDCDMLRGQYLMELLKPALSLYYFRDHLMATPYWFRHGHVFEPQLMKKSTLVCANSLYLKKIAEKYNPNTFVVGSGVDLNLFDAAKKLKVPDDMAGIKGPIIGYIGAIISNRLDLRLLIDLCRKRKDWSFVFIGKADHGFKSSELFKLPNVHFLGWRPESTLPGYLQCFDVAMNPQAVNEMTIGNYPRKIDEYLSMGKATVATDTIFMRDTFVEYVYLGKTTADYEELIAQALRENVEQPELKERRIRFGRTHSWAAHIKSISEAIEKVQPGWNDPD
jgi:teichuronic acid biosynthesis glycosyltransferase TuaH